MTYLYQHTDRATYFYGMYTDLVAALAALRRANRTGVQRWTVLSPDGGRLVYDAAGRMGGAL